MLHLSPPTGARIPLSPILVQSVRDLQTGPEKVGPRGDSSEKQQSRVWKIEETSSQRQGDIDTGVPSGRAIIGDEIV
jgi:hypothetical protein